MWGQPATIPTFIIVIIIALSTPVSSFPLAQVGIMARKFEGVIMIGVFMIVAGCFSIPIIIYAASSQDTTTNSSVVIEQLDINQCSQQVSS